MPAKKARGKAINVIQNKQTKKDNKPQNQKNEPKFVKKFVEIKNTIIGSNTRPIIKK